MAAGASSSAISTTGVMRLHPVVGGTDRCWSTFRDRMRARRRRGMSSHGDRPHTAVTRLLPDRNLVAVDGRRRPQARRGPAVQLAETLSHRDAKRPIFTEDRALGGMNQAVSVMGRSTQLIMPRSFRP